MLNVLMIYALRKNQLWSILINMESEEEFRLGKVIFKNRHIRFNLTFDAYEKKTGTKRQILISYKPFLFAEPSNKKNH